MKYTLGFFLLYSTVSAANSIYLVNKTDANIDVTYINCRIFDTWDGEVRTQNDVDCASDKHTLTIPANNYILSPFTSPRVTPRAPESFNYLSSYITEVSSPSNNFQSIRTPITPEDYEDRCNITPIPEDCSFDNFFPVSLFPSNHDLALVFDDFGVSGFINISTVRYGRQ